MPDTRLDTRFHNNEERPSIRNTTTRSIDEEEEIQRPAEPWKNTKPSLFKLRNSKKRAKKLLARREGNSRPNRRNWRVFAKRRNRFDNDNDIEEDSISHNHQNGNSDHSPLLVGCLSDSAVQDYSLLNHHHEDEPELDQQQKEKPRSFTFDEGEDGYSKQVRLAYTYNKYSHPYRSSIDSETSLPFLDDQDDDDISYESVGSSDSLGRDINNEHEHDDPSRHMEEGSHNSPLHSPHSNLTDTSGDAVRNFNLTPTNDFTTQDYPNQRSIMRTSLMKCVRGITHNPVSKCILRLPSLADALPAILQILLQHPKTAFGGLIASCAILDLAIILPGYLLTYLITEYGVYSLVILTIWSLGLFILRTITFPGSTARARMEIEKEFVKYSFRMMTNATEAVESLVTNLVQEEDVSFYNRDYGGDKGQRVLGLGSGNCERYEVIPMWKKVCQYRNRVLGMYHDVLHCLLVENGDGAFNPDHSGGNALTKYGSNRLVGDIGKLTDVSPKARADGDVLLKILSRVLEDLDRLESCSKEYLESSMNDIEHKVLSSEGRRAAQRLLVSITEFGECLDSIQPSGGSTVKNNDGDDESEDGNVGHRPRRSIIREGFDNFKIVMVGMIEMFDPPPLDIIFGLDVLRGSMLSRYQGSQQLWIPRGKSEGGGHIDAIHIPSSKVRRNLSANDRMEKAVLFCNPNAGLLEVTTGLSLIGGNVSASNVSELSCWTDFYLENGYDIIVFNYVGYGRSHVGKRKIKGDFSGGIQILRRIISSSLFGFKPSPSSLKLDATAAATHIIEKLGVDKFVIHGESIGGMAASGAAKTVSHRKYVDANSLPVTYPTMLLCDRTFCNLNATAYRLVGTWTSSVIPLLTPFWNTDVAGDFSSARCRKVVAQDAADVIIHDAASLKKGIATAKEITKGKTSGVGTLGDIPLTYRMADYEDVGVQDSKIVTFPAKHTQAPSWPADKHIELSESFHFAACARRIGKLATSIRKNQLLNSLKQSPYEDEEEGIEITAVFSRDEEAPREDTTHYHDNVLEIWETLSRCDGLCGFPLGAAVKDGHDCTIDWLSCMTTLGSQRVALAAESRLWASSQSKLKGSFDNVIIEDEDFNISRARYKNDGEEVEIELLPMPLPEVIKELQGVFSTFNGISDEENSCKQGKNRAPSYSACFL